jgi:hypothetical protein
MNSAARNPKKFRHFVELEFSSKPIGDLLLGLFVVSTPAMKNQDNISARLKAMRFVCRIA